MSKTISKAYHGRRERKCALDIWHITFCLSHWHLAHHTDIWHITVYFITRAISMSQYIWHICIWHITRTTGTSQYMASHGHLAHQSCILVMSLSQPSSSGKTGVRGRYIALGKEILCYSHCMSYPVISCCI